MKFDHVGIACRNIEIYFRNYLKPLFGVTEITQTVTDYNQKSKIAFAITEDGARIELIEPLNGESPAQNILKKNNGGLYHLCFIANHLETDIQKLHDGGFLMIGEPKPAIAFNNRKVVFFMSPTFEIYELVEEEQK